MSKHKQYPMRTPLHATGIRAQEVRASVLRTWWAREWDERLETMGATGRLGRGRGYAMSGQVLSLSIADSRVVAEVQGARETPYEVTLDFRSPRGKAHKRIVDAIRAEPIMVARILADDMPMEVMSLFRDEGFDLFPGAKLGPCKYDTTVGCTCPDYANPCKHVMAVMVILGDEIARRPATLLELRGIRLEELLP